MQNIFKSNTALLKTTDLTDVLFQFSFVSTWIQTMGLEVSQSGSYIFYKQQGTFGEWLCWGFLNMLEGNASWIYG